MIKFAILGCGRISKRHSELLGFNKIKNASLVAVCDLDIKKAEAISKQFNVKAFTDMHEMLGDIDIDIDVVVILTESGNHAKHVLELAKYKKHIIVEKPMALTLSDADEMIKACDNNKIKLFVIKQNRFNVPVVKLREAITKKRFGKLVLGTVRVRWCRPQEYYDQDSWRGTWAMDGGIITNQASHHIDLLHYMMGDVESVHAMSTTALVDIQAEDTAVVNVKFKNGALGIIEATGATRPSDLEGSLSILGEMGSVVIGGFAVNKMETWNFTDKDSRDDEVIKKYSVNPPNVYGFGHQEYYEHVVDVLENRSEKFIDGREGRKSLEIITSIYESIETGEAIKLPVHPNLSKLGVDVG
jgi:UDP-N-acetyl-2-amino-2-deoxyglucuronate dehydrogenase